MNSPESSPGSRLACTIAIVGALLIVLVLVRAMQKYTTPAPVNEARARERRAVLKEVRATDQEALTTYGWVNQNKGFVRLPIKRAEEITLKEWQNPATARSNLISRVDKLNAKEANPFE